ncbi:uncharacterized protein LOC111646214 [Seriola lalandi dorsalis]|uniref:uncharacterized protein LOC111646214 n=1 Tax=Seriola lalandi dorsalis TaxID=1841481 RepID=UPI000C6F6174|nr:uncharacterized protein LOC111646214 [Seriola lalandi dorsalis]
MGRGKGPTRGRPPMGAPGDDGPPFDIGPPGWGPPPPGGWGPPPPDGWPPPPDEWGPPPPGGWGPPPPGGWGPPPPGGWGPPPPEWDPRGPPPPGWGPRGPPPPGWGPHPDDWLPPPEDWGRHPDDWRPPHPDDWRLHPDDWRPPREEWRRLPEDWGPDKPLPPPGWGHPGWGPEGPPEPWGPEPGPPAPVPPVPPPVIPPPVAIPPPDPAAYGAVPPVPPPSCVPPFGFPAYPPPGWSGEPVVEEPMPNPPPDQPEWIKALISAPASEATPGETKKSTDESPVTKTPAADPPAAAATAAAAAAATAPKPKSKPKPDPNKTAKALGLLGKRTFDKPPPGRSTGIISFIGPTFGYIEREDLEKFTFSFDAFFGNPKAMTPGVRVHFTACKEKVREARGVIISLKENEGVIKSDEHGELPFDIKENFSDVEFTAEDVNEEVEFTVITLKTGNRAIRIRRVKEPLLLTLCTATVASSEEAESEGENANGDSDGDSSRSLRGKANVKLDLAPNMKLDTELYEGIVSQPIIEPTPTLPGYPGQIHANIGPVRTNVTFDHRDCGVTLLKNDHVLINLLVDMVTRKRRAANIKPKIPFTFSYTKEKRELVRLVTSGIITYLGAEEGIVNSEEHGELHFDICENFSDTEFNANDIHKEVEFTTGIVSLTETEPHLNLRTGSEV